MEQSTQCVCDTPMCDDVPSTNTRGNRVLLKAASEKREEEENKEFGFFAPNSPKLGDDSVPVT